MRRYALPVLILLSTPVAAQQPDSGAGNPDAPGRPVRLYRDDTPIQITLRGDFRALFRDRDTTKVDSIPMTLQWVDREDSGSVALHSTTRGHFRLQRSTCSFPPIFLMFPEGATRGTMFRGDRRLKLVTHCRDGANYEQQVLREYLIYRILNTLTDLSLRVRLVRATYVDTLRNTSTTRYGFFLEDEDDMARRNGGEIDEVPGLQMTGAEVHYMALTGIFQYVIGNTDFSVPFLHNVNVVRAGGRSYPVPYDMDWSGLVNASYARPDYRLPIKTVRDRYYRGLCLPMETIMQVVALLNEKRPEIDALIEGVPGMDEKSRSWTRAYLGDAYKTLNDPNQVKQEIQRDCY